MTMRYPYVLPCPICGETPKTYEYSQDYNLKAICPNCGFDFDHDDNDVPAVVWNYGVKQWFEKGIPHKQCPKCRAKDEGNEYITLEQGSNGYYVMCQQCQHAGPFAVNIAAACILWNKQSEIENITTQDSKEQ